MLKRQLFRLGKRYGYEIRGQRSAFAMQRAVVGLIQEQQINVVLDVGANGGQFAGELREFGYKGRIISFEPLSTAHAELQIRAKHDANWAIGERTAIGAEKGRVEFHISENSVCSSILEILPPIVNAEPRARFTGSETVPVNRLDDLVTLAPNDRVLLKVDVQGYEMPVFKGAGKILKRCAGLVTELSLVPCYAGQVLASEMMDYLKGYGFDVWALEPVLHDFSTFRLLQMDGIFVRSR